MVITISQKENIRVFCSKPKKKFKGKVSFVNNCRLKPLTCQEEPAILGFFQCTFQCFQLFASLVLPKKAFQRYD